MPVSGFFQSGGQRAQDDEGRLPCGHIKKQRGLGVEFTDNSVSMTEKVYARVFNPFASFSETAAPNSEWLIVKRIVDVHHGSLSITSFTEGRTTVAITLPALS